jgi:hypothetical protein
MTPDPLMTYVARCKCHRVVMMIVDRPTMTKEIAREVGRCIKLGLPIERISIDEVRTQSMCMNRGKCTGPDSEPQAPLFPTEDA